MQIAESNRGMSRATLLEEPINVVLLSKPSPGDPYCRIIHDGQTWLVRERDIFTR